MIPGKVGGRAIRLAGGEPLGLMTGRCGRKGGGESGVEDLPCGTLKDLRRRPKCFMRLCV